MDHPTRKPGLLSAGTRSAAAIEPSANSIVRDPATTLIRINEVVAIVGLARPTIYKLLRQPESGFPQPVKLSESTARGAPVAWVLGEVQQWVLARIAARGKAAA
ncbi:AlpA family transcriptional regulator [Ectopseudomonas oleovorans]|uniref:helix-turn-helix transcriptional regulator n=1 Tax=Ectopseudomonas oleovorans TaxID=301 RepID=UPI00241E81A0|nr:AlpA family phage regulatory protein [Pseudomonas oleovorans]